MEDAEVIAAEEPEMYARPIVEQLRFRPFRDVAFTRSVRAIYNFTCAMTGLSISMVEAVQKLKLLTFGL